MSRNLDTTHDPDIDLDTHDVDELLDELIADRRDEIDAALSDLGIEEQRARHWVLINELRDTSPDMEEI